MFLSSALGTLGFAVLIQAPRKAWIPAGLIGGASYALYTVLFELGANEPAAIFTAALMGSLLAQFCARRMRMIATIFISLSIVSLVPGLGLYRCMSLLAQGQNSAGLQTGVAAMMSFLMITLGLAVGSFLFRMLLRMLPKKQS